MKLKFIKPQAIERNVKATIQNSGKLGFTREGADKLKLQDAKGMKIAVNEDDDTDKNLYIKLEKEFDTDSFRIIKGGQYFSANTRVFFDNQGIDYRSKKIIYDIVAFDYEGDPMFKFIKREVEKRIKKNNG